MFTFIRCFRQRRSDCIFRPGSREHARRRLRRRVLASFVCLALPLAILLSRVYTHLEREVFYQYRSTAEEVVLHLNQRLAEVLQAEENRAFDEYSFLNVASRPLLKGTTVTTSPLSELPPKSAVPGLLGYFQMNPDGSLHSPVLPELEERELDSNVDQFGFGADELAKRLALRRRLEQLLLGGTPVATRQDARRKVNEEPPFVAPAASKSELMEKKSAASSKSSGYRERRKEQVALPEQATASQVQGALDRLNTLSQPLKDQRNSSDAVAQAKPGTAAPLARQQATVKILTFESALDPLQCNVLPSGHLVFFRKAWRNNLRYVQGFVVEQRDFLQPFIDASTGDKSIRQLAALAVQYQGNALLSVPLLYPARTAPPTDTRQPMYRAPLETPLEMLELVFSAAHLPRGASAIVVDLLGLTLALGLLVGHYGIYRVGMQHIELAAQRSDFVAAVSHELKTPLTSIRMYGEMLRAGWIADETRRQAYYDFIFFESERLSRLIANVLQLARLTNQDAPLALQDYSLYQLLDVVRSKVSTQAEAAGFTIQWVVPSTGSQEVASYTVRAEEDAFTQIFINLVDNAIKFSARSGLQRIDVGVRLTTGRSPQAVFFVRDYGPGVAREQMQRIFQLFYRGENELTRHTQGTGIGLALVKELAVKMYARVEVQNHAPGAEFRLLLPVGRQHDANALSG